MARNVLQHEQLKALCLLRAGITLEDACAKYGVGTKEVIELAASLESLPDSVISSLERLSGKNARLRNQIASNPALTRIDDAKIERRQMIQSSLD